MKQTITTAAVVLICNFNLFAQNNTANLILNTDKSKIQISVKEFQSKKNCTLELNDGNAKDNNVKSAIVYFVYKDNNHSRFAYDENSKNDQQKIVLKTLNGNSMESLKTSFDLLLPGDMVVFDAIKTTDKMGREKNIGGCSFILK